MRSQTLVAAAVLSLSVAVDAVQVQSQSAPDPRGSRLTEHVDTLESFLIRGRDTTRYGRAIDELRIVERQGRRVLQRVYRSEALGSGAQVDTLIDDFETLAPIQQTSRSSRAIELIAFSSSRAIGWMWQPTGDSLRIDVPLNGRTFSSSSFDLVLRASPLADGWRTSVPAFVTSSRAVVPMTARVNGKEVVDGVSCFRVDAEFQGMPVTFWIAEASRRMCKQEMRPQVGLVLLFRSPKATRDRIGAT